MARLLAHFRRTPRRDTNLTSALWQGARRVFRRSFDDWAGDLMTVLGTVIGVARKANALASGFVRCGWVVAREFAVTLVRRTDDSPSRAFLLPTCVAGLAAIREFPRTPGSSGPRRLHRTS